MNPIPLIVNPSAGRRRTKPERLAAAFGRAGVRVEPRPVQPDGIADAVRAAAQAGAPVVAVAGGDGSLRTAAEVLAGSDTVLLPVPAGTLNHFARRMRVGSVGAAVEAAANGRVLTVALGTVEGRVFLNTGTCGLYAPLIRRREVLRQRFGKWIGAAIAGWAALSEVPPIEASITAAGKVRRERLLLAWAGMGRGSFPSAFDADAGPGADILELVLVRAQPGGPLRGVPWRELVRAARGDHPADDSGPVTVLHVPEFRVDSPHRVDVTLDGEPMQLDPPLAFSVRPAALRVMVPADSAHDD